MKLDQENKFSSNKLLLLEWPFLIYGFLMSFWSSFGQTFFISLFSNEIRSELVLTHGDFGTYYAIATLTSALILFWLGKFTDNVSVPWLSLLTLFGVSLSAFYFSTVNSVLTLTLGFLFLRLSGQGMMYMVYSTAITRRYNKIRGRALAISGFGMNMAEATFPILVIFALGLFSWRSIWVGLSLVAFFSFGPFVYWLTKNKPPLLDKNNSSKNSVNFISSVSINRNGVMKDSVFWLVIIWLTIIPAFTVTGLFFHQIYISELKGIPLLIWSSNYFYYAVAAIFGAFLSGYLVDKFGAHMIASITQLPMLLACLILWFFSSNFFLAIFFVLFGLGSGMLQPMINSLLAERYGTKWLGEIKSLAMPLNVISSAFSPILMGFMIDAGFNLGHLMLLLVLFCIFSFMVSFISFNLLGMINPSKKCLSN